MATLDLFRRLAFFRVAASAPLPGEAGADHRGAPRRAVAADVELREVGQQTEPLPLRLREVSATGAFVQSGLLLPVGAAVELSFRLAGGAGAIRAEGRVVRVEERAEAAGMGIRFERLPPAAQDRLRRYTR